MNVKILTVVQCNKDALYGPGVFRKDGRFAFVAGFVIQIKIGGAAENFDFGRDIAECIHEYRDIIEGRRCRQKADALQLI